MEKVTDDTPPAEMPPKERLGRLIRRYRVAAGKGLNEVASHLNLSNVVLGEVERGLASLQAAQLQELAAFLDVRYEPLLNAARDWNRAVWEGQGKGGVRLVDTKAREGHLREEEGALEAELIEASDKLVFLSNVLYEAARGAEEAAEKARDLLRARGVKLASDEVREVQCAGPLHGDQPLTLRPPRDTVIHYRSEEGEDFYFCSKTCAGAWAEEKGIEPKMETADG